MPKGIYHHRKKPTDLDRLKSLPELLHDMTLMFWKTQNYLALKKAHNIIHKIYRQQKNG